jgi:hypothetical protein
MLQDFVHFGAADFTNEKHRAWFFYDSRYLYWFMQSFRYGHRRAETTGHDQSFLGDDSMMLFVSDTAGSVYRVMVNPAGATHDMKMKPKPDKGWNPQVSVLTDATETEHWRIAVRVPWQDLLGPDFEAVPGTTVPVNLVTGRSIAPRIMSSWHPWLPPYDPTSTLGTMILGEAAK